MTTGWRKRGSAHWPNGSGSSRAYRKKREASLTAHLAAGGGCELRVSPQCNGRAEEWHHTRDRRVYGDDPRYMVWSCHPCNIKAGDPTKGDPAPREAGTTW